MMPGDLPAFEAICWRRRSVRAFLPDPVDRDLIGRAVLAAAMAPSSCNTQPWRLHIASGEALARLGDALANAARGGVVSVPEVEHAASYRDRYRERQVDAAVRLFAAQGVDRHDRTGRETSFLRNYAFFGAPHAAFLFLPTHGGLREAADCGKFAQTFMLALAAAGLGSCAQGSLAHYPDIVRQTLALPEGGRLLIGISFGHPDEAHPTASVRPERCALSELVEFH